MLANRTIATLTLLLATAGTAALAQTQPAPKQLTDADYARAEHWMSYNLMGLVQHTVRDTRYLPDGRVFFADAGEGATPTVYKIADPARGTVEPAFDAAKLATALNTAVGTASKAKFDANQLNVTDYTPDATGFTLQTRAGKFHCDSSLASCAAVVVPGETQPAAGARRRRGGSENIAPDGRQAVFIRDWNLWLRDLTTGSERQLTIDGTEDYGYATDNAGWQHSDNAVATWSADSKKIATFRLDQRKTGMMYLVSTTFRHPTLEAWHYPLVGDKDVTMIEPVVIDIASGTVVKLKVAPLQHRSTECDDVSCAGGKWTDAEFSADDKHLLFVSTSRDHKDETVELAETTTGDVRDVYKEHVDTYYGWQSRTNFKYLSKSNELLWVSERSNTAQVYLYDLATGALKNEVTHGDGPVQDLVAFDEAHRVLYFIAVGKEKNVDPYYEQLYRVDFDGKQQELLTPEPLTHQITIAADGSSFVDVYSNVATPETAVLRDSHGKVLATLAKQDISALLAAGWKPPMEVKVKARDGVTPLEGMLWRPTNFDPTQKYPVVDNVYPGPQGSLCQLMGRNFSAAKGDEQALAELGFVVVCIDGMGNPGRTKSFHDAHASSPAEMGDDTIPDQVAGIKNLAAQFPWVDATRVGIWGHSGGGNATVSAMFHFGDFFKVGWAESGNHDNRDYEDDWDERWAGLETIDAKGHSNYDAHANENYAANLQGKLMLVHGTMDDNVPPSNTFLVADALIKANKDFDMLMVPNAHHAYGEASQYVMRRRWDYFVQNLMGATPPHEYKMATYAEIIRKLYGPAAVIGDPAQQ
jgi:dipeptidyl aminopeptidase/acylaminoacyl peptidase